MPFDSRSAVALLCLPYRLIIEVEPHGELVRLAAESVFVVAAGIVMATLLARAWSAPARREAAAGREIATAAAEAA